MLILFDVTYVIIFNYHAIILHNKKDSLTTLRYFEDQR